MARILGFHPRGPGSIPGVGDHFLQTYLEDFYNLMIFDVAQQMFQNSFLK